nr:MAG TPA: hypothetical protein [Caudoviricetes sp.]
MLIVRFLPFLSVRMGKVLCASVKNTLLVIFLTQKVCIICKR